MKKTTLDNYEKSIEKDISNYRKISSAKSTKIEHILKKAKEKQSISLRLNRQDLEQLKSKSEKAGIPYQTFISSILHKFVTDQLVDQHEMIKSIQLLNNR